MGANAARDAAAEIVARLRAAGQQAYFVGGCVRDLLMGREPKDFDVATSALPDQVLTLFEKTFSVGAHFGVVLVSTGEIVTEVATFRSDGAYSDGRHPDAVRFSTSAEGRFFASYVGCFLLLRIRCTPTDTVTNNKQANAVPAKARGRHHSFHRDGNLRSARTSGGRKRTGWP